MRWERVAAVTGAGGYGSGYVVANRLVVTSAHVVGKFGAAVEVFRPGRRDGFAGRVAWRGRPNGRHDAALVVVDDPAWVPVEGEVRWGRSVTHRPGIRCECWGVPDVAQHDGQWVDTAHVTGTLNPGDRMVGDRYVIHLDGHPPAPRDVGDSPWAGMSGAAVFCGELLAGVIAVDPAERQHAALEAVPAYLLLRDPGFRTALAAYAPATVAEGLAAIELVGLADPESHARRERAMASPSALLAARRAVVPFRGRAETLDDLRAWADRRRLGMWLLHGPAGQGKTRLAHQFGEQQADQGWAVLWIDPEAAESDLGVLADVVVPTLLVVDYAESRAEQLHALLRVLVRRHGSEPLKVLLLARTVGSWWEQLGDVGDTVRDVLETAQITALPVLDVTTTALQDAYQAAVTAFAAALAKLSDLPDTDWGGIASELTNRSTTVAAGSPTVLAVQMTALSDLLDAATSHGSPHREGASPAPLTGQGPEDRLLAHERSYWRATATSSGLLPALSLAALTDAVAAAVLLGAPTPEEADEWIARIPGVADQPRDRRDQVRAWLASLYPPLNDGQRAFEVLQPDRLSERLIGRLMLDRTRTSIVQTLACEVAGERAARWVRVCVRAAAHTVFEDQAAAMLTQLCTSFPDSLGIAAVEVAPQVEVPTPLVAAVEYLANDQTLDTAIMQRLADTLPEHSHILAECAAALSASLVARRREALSHDPTADRPDLASTLNDLSVRLGVVGRREEALEVINEAITIRRELADAHPDTHLPHLAMSLNNLAINLIELGQQEKALEAINEAVHVHHELAQAHPDAHLPALAMSLTNLAANLAALGQQEKALEAINEAITIRRELAGAHPDAHLRNLAGSLNNLAANLAALGQQEKALEAINEAVHVHHELAQAHPDAHLPDLAFSLNNLAAHLALMGQWEKALEASNGAVHVYHELAQAHPDAYLPDLSDSLNNLGTTLGELGWREAALSVIYEAIAIRRELAQARPDAYLPDLAVSLNNLAANLAALGQQEKALEAINEAITIRRELARALPDAHLPYLAMSLTNLALGLGELGRQEAALEAINEAITIRRTLVAIRPAAHHSELERELRVLRRLEGTDP